MNTPTVAASEQADPENMAISRRPAVNRYGIPLIGIVGGIGSGKSSVARWVAEHAPVSVIDADALGHAALREDHVIRALSSTFGPEILGSDGQIIRSVLAAKVFGSSETQREGRRELERVVHPEIKKKIVEHVVEAAKHGQNAALLDAAILLETGWEDDCNLVIFVQTPNAIRLQRVQRNRGWTAEELERREASQWSLARKQSAADLTVVNDRELAHAGQQLLDALQKRGFLH